jgi:outer membrane protein OmpA-like peptidoglycan-associated protein
MRQAALLLAVLLYPAASALAQVTVDLHALDALPGARAPAAKHAPVRRQAAKPAAKTPATASRPTPAPAPQSTASATAPLPAPATGATAAEAPRVTAPPPPPAATLPIAPPASVALAPLMPPPPPPVAPSPPPPPPISDSATGAATAIGNGLRVTFGAGQSDLSAAGATAIQALVHDTQTTDNTSFNVVAYAAGTPEDPSTARRLSLSRALAVRSALIAGGVNSARIYVRALGAATGDGPADRADLTVMGSNMPAASPASTPVPLPSRPSQQP